MFIDEKLLTVTAGKGGDGATLFRREKYVAYGGPDGGDGGKGGSVYLVGTANLHALNHLAYTDKIDAEPGIVGGHQKSSGKSGEHTYINLPLGTVVSVQGETGEYADVIEFKEEGEELLIAKGGNGGWGNWHFKSSIQQTPDRHNDGLPGEKMLLKLTLKLIADVGLIGLPNAGKSTLLSVISAAKPKIANYPFTTLEPQLGVANLKRGTETDQVVVADVPGLIEGASEGKGLGTKFLKHVERTKILVHCIDAATPLEEIIPIYTTIRAELSGWSEVLAAKAEIIVLTKSELVTPEELEEKRKLLTKHTKEQVLSISAVTQQGLSELLAVVVDATKKATK
jgi:GTP-binding protein